ncbi:hypothetical protein GLAREA_08543 [Glarea lozoyensis ATCC 20868]|uniref:Uncharacterized protein n=1 Tax=Glarea lozoyensis (strain ATCC 20868 / MF5171) TaxID=1116229 RepID=S3CFG0_GLAL2|nr:uncharacterized protein GLAREA_08543 [Glarea lozoyensis ATCC 20868]EPE24690.1 hypothetical protein GLAREA_08543 [Glarea lozoyensis ATCC 20868]
MRVDITSGGKRRHEDLSKSQQVDDRSRDGKSVSEMTEHVMDSIVSKANDLITSHRRWLDSHLSKRSQSPQSTAALNTSTTLIPASYTNSALDLPTSSSRSLVPLVTTRPSARDQDAFRSSSTTLFPYLIYSISTLSSPIFFPSTIDPIDSQRARNYSQSTSSSLTSLSSALTPVIVPRSTAPIIPGRLSSTTIIFLTVSSSRASIPQITSIPPITSTTATSVDNAAEQSLSSAISSANAAITSAQSSASAALESASQQLGDVRASASSALRHAQSSITAIASQATTTPTADASNTPSTRTLALALTFSIIGSSILSLIAFILFLRYRRRQQEKRMGFRVSDFTGSQDQIFRRELDDPVAGYGGTGSGTRIGYAEGGRFTEKPTPTYSPNTNGQSRFTFPAQMPESTVMGNILVPDAENPIPRQSSDKRVLITQVPTSKFSTNLIPNPLTPARKITLTYDPDRPREPPRFRSFGDTRLPPLVTSSSHVALRQNNVASGFGPAMGEKLISPSVGTSIRSPVGGRLAGDGVMFRASEILGISGGGGGGGRRGSEVGDGRVRSVRGEIFGGVGMGMGGERVRKDSDTLGDGIRMERGRRRGSSIGTAI